MTERQPPPGHTLKGGNDMRFKTGIALTTLSLAMGFTFLTGCSSTSGGAPETKAVEETAKDAGSPQDT